MKKSILLFSLIFLAAACNPFAAPVSAGVYKTLNGGSDWKPANALKTGSVGISSAYISKLGFDPNNSQTVFAGSYTNGLFESNDSAGTWTNILSNINVYDFAVSPQNSKIIYAAGFYGGAGRVVKTTDGGASWNEVYHEASATNPVRSIALNPQNPSEVVIGTASGSVIKSSDGGISWQLAKNFSDQVNEVLWQGDVFVLLKNNGLYESTDSGATFTELTASLKNPNVLGSIDITSLAIVGTYHQVYVDTFGAGLIYLTTDKGLYKSMDGGKTWVAQSLPVKPGQDPARAIAVSKNNSAIVYVSVGGTVYKSLDGGASWQTQGIAATGFVNYVLVDPNLPQISYAGVYINSNN
jgi:photosystem II stability/assembly factor-like uncharacterized protein